MREATQGAAAAFVEDLAHMRKVIAEGPPDQGALRRLSVVLRRLLVNREIQEIATPRIGRFIIDAPDEKPLIDAVSKLPLQFFASGGGAIRFGDGNYLQVRGMTQVEGRIALSKPPDYDLDKRVPLKVDNFIAQRVFYIQENWITRNQVIKYVANIGSGAHSGTPQNDEDRRIAALRASVVFAVGEQLPDASYAPLMHFDRRALTPGPFKFTYTKDAIDPLLIEMIATTEYLCASSHTSTLESAVKSEMGIP